MMPENRNSSLLGNGSINTSRKRTLRNYRRAVFSVVRAALVAGQRRGKRTSASMNRHETIEEAVFPVGVAPMLYNEDLSLLKLEFIKSAVEGD
jgi:hypothetical protein